MSRFRAVTMFVCFAMVALVLPTRSKADEQSQKTTMTFNQPVEIPGKDAQVLPPGTYVFKLLDASSDHHVVQILNQRGDRIYATILAIPNYRLRATDQTVITFGKGQPAPLKPSGLGSIPGTIGVRNLCIPREEPSNWRN